MKLLFATLALLCPPHISAAAPRTMSADFCADQFVLALADPQDIAALSPDARKDFSYLRASVGTTATMRPEAEAVARLRPDIVLRFWGGEPRMLEKLGANVVTLGYADDFKGVEENIRTAAESMGQSRRGETLIAEMNKRLAALQARSPKRAVAALYLTPGGVTAGRGTFIHSILDAARVDNAASALGGWPALPIERIIADPPELIITGFFSAHSEAKNHWSVARHPAVATLLLQTPAVHLGADLVSCPGWFALDAAEQIADAAGALHE